MRIVLPTLFFATVAIAGRSGPLAAQPAPAPSAADRELAKRYVDSGLAAQDDGDYDAAIAHYEQAYQVVPHPVLLFDMAQAYRLAGKTDEAIAFYTRYLAEDPTGPKAQDARTLLAELQVGAAEPPHLAEPLAPPPGSEPSGPPGLSGTVKAAAPESAESAPSQGHGLRWAGIATVGLGAASLAIGAGYGVRGQSLSDSVSKQFDVDKDQAGRRANTMAITGLVAGAGLVVVGGALWWWADRRSSHAAQISVVPTVSGHLTGFVVSGDLR